MDHFEQVGTRGFYRPIGHATFEKAVDTLGSTLDDRFKIELVGPLPPYHFADLRLAE